MTFPRKFVPTKSGWIFFGFMLTIIVFAYSTSNNLLFLLFSAMMSLMVLSGLMSESSLGEIVVTRHFPREIFARRPFELRWEFRNEARFAAAYAFYPVDRLLFPDEPGPLIVRVAPGETRRIAGPASLPERGRYRLPDYQLTTQYPFLLFTKSREMDAGEEVVVYPALVPVELSLERLFSRADEGPRERREEGDRFSCLREYEPGEPIHKVDWKKSARLDELVVKEFDRAETRRVRVSFLPGRSQDLERGLEVAASVLVWLFDRQFPFALDCGDWSQPVFDHSPAHLRQALLQLAIYDTPGQTPSHEDRDRGIVIDADGQLHIR